MHLYPMLTTPILKEKVWGGDRLRHLNKPVQPGGTVGESWELVSLPATSPDGGGGDAAHSPIANGPDAGRTLADAIEHLGTQLLGKAALTNEHAFPLLAKFLDARDNLSVQVHPSPEFATHHPKAHLKTETWYILDAEPDAVIYKGIKPGVTAHRFEDAVRDNAVESLLNAVPATPGDTHHMPSGICHALGAGVLVAEIQMPSDTTFRVYDWGRAGRTLHLEQAMACLAFPGEKPAAPARSPDGASEPVTLEHNEHYAIAELRCKAAEALEVGLPHDTPTVIVCTRGAGIIEPLEHDFDAVPFRAGDTVLVPAAIDDLRLAFEEDTTLLDVTVRPDA
jgi:mannose-6-phosphate isomerase